MNNRYESEQDYVTNEKPLSKTDKYWKYLFRVMLVVTAIITLPKLLGTSYSEIYNKFF